MNMVFILQSRHKEINHIYSQHQSNNILYIYLFIVFYLLIQRWNPSLHLYNTETLTWCAHNVLRTKAYLNEKSLNTQRYNIVPIGEVDRSCGDTEAGWRLHPLVAKVVIVVTSEQQSDSLLPPNQRRLLNINET